MKLKCKNCEQIYYSDRRFSRCEECGGEIETVPIPGSKEECPVSSEEVKLINGLPSCGNFRLVNSMGHRCTKGQTPGDCKLCEQSAYDPRVAVVN